MTNNDRINEAIAILQTQNMEDCAQAIDNLRHELERIKGIASRRLDRIAQLQRKLSTVVDPELEASLNRIRELDELGREPRSHLENELADLRASAFRSADAAQYIVNYCH